MNYMCNSCSQKPKGSIRSLGTVLTDSYELLCGVWWGLNAAFLENKSLIPTKCLSNLSSAIFVFVFFQEMKCLHPVSSAVQNDARTSSLKQVPQEDLSFHVASKWKVEVCGCFCRYLLTCWQTFVTFVWKTKAFRLCSWREIPQLAGGKEREQQYCALCTVWKD